MNRQDSEPTLNKVISDYTIDHDDIATNKA